MCVSRRAATQSARSWLSGASSARPGAAGPPAGRRWALVVGVNEYNDGLLRRLDYSAADARLMSRVLTTRCQFPAEQVVLMTDDAADARLLPFQRQVAGEVERLTRLA